MSSVPASKPPAHHLALPVLQPAAPIVLTPTGPRGARAPVAALRGRPAWRLAAALGAIALIGNETAAPTAEPAPAAPAVAVTEPAAPRVPSPREQCERRMLLALQRCLKRVCEQPAMSAHRECRRMRQVETGIAASHER